MEVLGKNYLDCVSVGKCGRKKKKMLMVVCIIIFLNEWSENGRELGE